MQTFLPYPDFAESVRCLDRLRLGKQRVEVLQLANALLGKTTGWANHPAARMWRGRERALLVYGLEVCKEWVRRGYNDTTTGKLVALFPAGPIEMPPWLGDHAFHASHKSNLLRKDFKWYSQFGWSEPADLPYIWPV